MRLLRICEGRASLAASLPQLLGADQLTSAMDGLCPFGPLGGLSPGNNLPSYHGCLTFTVPGEIVSVSVPRWTELEQVW